MKKLILAFLTAGALALGSVPAQAHGGWGWGYHGGYGGYYGYRPYPYYGGFGFGLASGLVIGAAVSSPWYYGGYGYYGGGPYYGYYSPSYYYYAPPVYRTAPAPSPAPAQTPAPAAQPTTIINNYYYNSSPMSGANALFGR